MYWYMCRYNMYFNNTVLNVIFIFSVIYMPSQ